MADLINYSEFNVLTQCERKWVYQYVLNQEEVGAKRGLHLGTLIHLWHGRWLCGQGATLPGVWSDDINTGGKPGEERRLSLDDFEPELVERALWLAARFEKVYGSAPPSSWRVISAEEWMTREFTWGTLVGRTDGLVEIDGKLWLIEVKSYGSRPGPLAYAQVSPQLGCYSLLAEAKYGERPFGVLYQGVYTYQWKPKVPSQKDLNTKAMEDRIRIDGVPFGQLPKKKRDAWTKAQQAVHPGLEREPEESFDDLEVEIGDDHMRTTAAYLENAISRREILAEWANEALPSIGQQCRNCGFRPQCWADLGGYEEGDPEIEVEDDEPV